MHCIPLSLIQTGSSHWFGYENDILARKYSMNIHNKCHNIKHTSLLNLPASPTDIFKEQQPEGTQDHLYLRFAM